MKAVTDIEATKITSEVDSTALMPNDPNDNDVYHDKVSQNHKHQSTGRNFL